MTAGVQNGGTLALIPVRGGSKSIPDKNIFPFRGKPLIVHSIEQALQARHVGHSPTTHREYSPKRNR